MTKMSTKQTMCLYHMITHLNRPRVASQRPFKLGTQLNSAISCQAKRSLLECFLHCAHLIETSDFVKNQEMMRWQFQ